MPRPIGTRLAVIASVASLALPAPGRAAEAAVRSKSPDLGKKSEARIPEAALAGDISRKKAKKEEREAPAIEYDQFRLQVELQVGSKRREQIQTLQKIIRVTDTSTPDGKREAPDLLFRLAELHWEESRAAFFDANRKDDDIIRAKADKNKPALERAEREKKEILQQVSAYAQQAMDRYRIIVQKYPKYFRMDEVLFFLGHNMWESGKEADATIVYKKLITDHSKSKYLPDAWVALGQHWFGSSRGRREDLQRALEAFKRAASFTENKVYGYALYMQGWSHYNLGEFAPAMELFKAVILFGEFAGTEKTKEAQKLASLAKEARKDFVLAFSHVGDVKEAKAEFENVGGKESAFGMLKGLAGLYFDNGKDKEATIVYRTLINERPCHAETPFFQGRIVDALIRVGNKRLTVEQVRQLVKLIQEVEKTCPPKTDADKKSYADAKIAAERYLSNLAVNWHNEAKKTRDENTFYLTNEVYGDYLSVFPDAAKSYDLRFFYAELLNDNLQKYDRAAEEYSRVLLVDILKVDPPKGSDGRPQRPAAKAGRWMQNAAYNAILAYDEVVKKFEEREGPPQRVEGKSALVIPAPKKNLLVACERYIRYVRAEKLVEVMYKAANIYYRYNLFESAVKLFGQIALEHPQVDLAEYAVNLILDSYNLQNNLEKVLEWARRFHASEPLLKAHPKLREDLAKVLEQTSFKLVNQSEQKDEPRSVADHYLAFVREFPKSDLADDALFNASEFLFKARDLDRTIEVRKQIIARYAQSPYVAQCIFANAAAADSMSDFDTAADNYERYFHLWDPKRGGKKSPRPAARDADPSKKAASRFEESKAQAGLFNAGIYREALGELPAALRNRSDFLGTWPGAKDSEAVFLSVAGLHEKMGQIEKAKKQIEEYQKKYVTKDTTKLFNLEQRIVRMLEKRGQKAAAAKVLERAQALYRRLPQASKKKVEGAGIEPVARGLLADAEVDYADFVKVKVTAKDGKDFKDSVGRKAKALKELNAKYTEIVKLKAGDPAICALYKLGTAYLHMVDTVLATPPYDILTQPKVIEERKKVEEQIRKKLTEALRAYKAVFLVKYLMDRVPYAKLPKRIRNELPQDAYEPLFTQIGEATQQIDQEFKNQGEEFKSTWKVELDKQVEPARQSAVEALSTAVQKSHELDLFNDCARRAKDLLYKLQPERFPKLAEEVVALKLPAEWRRGGGLLADLQPLPEPRSQAPPSLPPPAPRTEAVAKAPPSPTELDPEPQPATPAAMAAPSPPETAPEEPEEP